MDARVTIDLLLLAHALNDDGDAAFLAFRLDTQRRAADWADVRAIEFWRAVLDVLRRHSDFDARFAAFKELGMRDAVVAALGIPQHVVEAAGPIAELARVWNAGEGTQWKFPVAGATVADSHAPARSVRRPAA